MVLVDCAVPTRFISSMQPGLLGAAARYVSRVSRAQPPSQGPRACALEVRALLPVHRVDLIDAPVSMVHAYAPLHALKCLALGSHRRAYDTLRAHLVAPDGVHRLVGQGNHMKPIKVDPGLGQHLGDALGVGGAHVHADVFDVVRIATVRDQVGLVIESKSTST